MVVARMYGRDNAINVFVFQYTDFYFKNIYDFPCCSVCKFYFILFFFKGNGVGHIIAIPWISIGETSMVPIQTRERVITQCCIYWFFMKGYSPCTTLMETE